MAHNLDFSNGRANIAFLGSRNDVWHNLGTEMRDGMSIDQWAAAAGLDWSAIKSPGYYYTNINGTEKLERAPERSFMVRSDTGAMLGDNCVSDMYQPVQPREILDWFQQYISVDDRFALDVAGSLKGGSIIWATAVWRDSVQVAGDAHTARVLMSTTFDGSAATINQMTTTRVVCNNTLRLAHSDKHDAVIKTRHNTKFDAKAVGAELASLAQSVASFKVVGDAMASVHMSADQVRDFFKDCLGIPHDAPTDKVSTRKLNQYRTLANALATTRCERNAAPGDSVDVWSALQAVTRFVDHDRTTSKGDNGEKAFTSATFGSGDAVKGKAIGLLMPLVKDLIAA